MKKLLIAAFGIAITCTTLYSCNNGDYDTIPDADQSGVLNPQNPNSGTTVHLGAIVANIDNKQVVFSPAFHFDDTNGYRHIYGTVPDDSILQRRMEIIFIDPIPDTPHVYNITADTAKPIIYYSFYDTSDINGNRKIYTANTGQTLGYASIAVNGKESGNMRGYIFGNFYLKFPQLDLNDSAIMSYSEYYVPPGKNPYLP